MREHDHAAEIPSVLSLMYNRDEKILNKIAFWQQRESTFLEKLAALQSIGHIPWQKEIRKRVPSLVLPSLVRWLQEGIQHKEYGFFLDYLHNKNTYSYTLFVEADDIKDLRRLIRTNWDTVCFQADLPPEGKEALNTSTMWLGSVINSWYHDIVPCLHIRNTEYQGTLFTVEGREDEVSCGQITLFYSASVGS